ncbi:MAG: recombinase family protein [Flavipsychrobacter sp.]
MTIKKSKAKYFLYARKSSESDEKQMQSINNQIAVLQELADRNDIDIVDIIAESKSAKEPFIRQGFTEMIERIKKGEANGILVWHTNRLFRNPHDFGMVQWLLQNGTISSIFTPERNHLPDDNALLLAVEASMANQYVRDLSKAVRRGLKNKVKQGWYPGIAPVGYLNTKNSNHGDNYIKKDPKRFPIIKKCWELMLTGNYLPSQILSTLNKEWGFRTPIKGSRGGNPMSRSALYRMFNDIFYTGLFEYAGQTTQGNHTPMITIEQYERVQMLLGNNRRRGGNNHKYTYTGLINCAECGKQLTATYKTKFIKATKIHKPYVYYYCLNAKKNKCTQKGYISEEIIEETVIKELACITLHPDWLPYLKKVLQKLKPQTSTKQDAIEQSKLDTIKQTQQQIDNLLQIRLKGLIDDEVFSKEKNRLEADLLRLKTYLKENQATINKKHVSVNDVLLFSVYAYSKFIKGDSDTRRKIASSLSCSNWTYKDKKLLIHKAECYQPLEKFKYRRISPIGVFELKQSIYSNVKSPYSIICPIVRGLWDAIRTKLNSCVNKISIYIEFDNKSKS